MHPIRREILSLLAERRCTFTEILKNLGIESSHLAYHLESLGELISKTPDGSYELSQIGRRGLSILELSMNRSKNPLTVDITKYWLPSKLFPSLPIRHIPWPTARLPFSLRGIPRMHSIAVDRDTVWFYLHLFRFMIGQLQLKKSTARVNLFVVGVPYTGFQFDDLQAHMDSSIEWQKKRHVPRAREREWQHASEGIAVTPGYVWYGIRRGRHQPSENHGHSGKNRGMIISVTEYQALCKLHHASHRVTYYLFPPESTVPLRTHQLKGDAQGRTLWGPTIGNTGWIFDTQTHHLIALTLGGGVYQQELTSGHTRVLPKHELRDVAVEPTGQQGWFMDSGNRLPDATSALYRFAVADERLMKYPLPDHRPVSIDIAPNGMLWFTSIERARWRENLPVKVRDIIHPSICEYSLHSLDPATNRLMTFQIPYNFGIPLGLMIDHDGIVWFRLRSLLHEGRCGLAKFQPQGDPASTAIVVPQEVKDWELKQYSLTEVLGEKLLPHTFELFPNQPDEHNYRALPMTIRSRSNARSPDPTPSYLFYPLDSRSPEIAVDLAGDHHGRIWYTTQNGYIGVLTPLPERRTVRIR
jgi:hypothetical protein